MTCGHRGDTKCDEVKASCRQPYVGRSSVWMQNKYRLMDYQVRIFRRGEVQNLL